MEERRRATRRETPLFVALEHPQIGSVETFVGDLSEDGLFVMLRDSGLSGGARMKLTPRPADSGRHSHAPTLQVEVRRVSETGVGLTFVGSNARILWQRWLAVNANSPAVPPAGHRLFLALVLQEPDGRVLLGRSDRRWQLPALGLRERGDWRDAVAELAAQLSVEPALAATPEVVELLEIEPADGEVEAAGRMHVIVRLTLQDAPPPNAASYEDLRWVGSVRETRELTFAHAAEQNWLIQWLDLQGEDR